MRASVHDWVRPNVKDEKYVLASSLMAPEIRATLILCPDLSRYSHTRVSSLVPG